MSNSQEDKKKVKKGCIAVRVGLEEEDGGFQRFVIPISYLYHPLFKRLSRESSRSLRLPHDWSTVAAMFGGRFSSSPVED
ncbi:hypothetical protein OIU77_006761 [Salix suchowensis]|uniref:Uncharacterized protein n=1 Tax=Salix suchowensis TaxID=1278906 RepID=A0ABQ9AM12_9ROSI|nr:hypothetical protein OIU77_006761 [Salix suchowensis]